MDKYVVALDLHGTLLDPAWSIPGPAAGHLCSVIDSLRDRCRFCIATGNDLEFVHQHVPAALLKRIDAVILETGAVLAAGERELVLAGDAAIGRIRELERHLRADLPGEVLFLGRRLASISLFTRSEDGGTDPARLHLRILARVAELGFAGEVTVTHSDVAVDIIPAGFSKYTGVLRFAGTSPTIGIADSLNDLALIRDADSAFLPANASPALLTALQAAGRAIIPLEAGRWPDPSEAGQSGRAYTDGVLDILAFLAEHLPQNIGAVGDDRIDPEP